MYSFTCHVLSLITILGLTYQLLNDAGRMTVGVLSIEMPAANGKLNMYILPVGQGDAHVIQCPKGEISIIDMGSSGHAFWNKERVREFLQPVMGEIRTILITHFDTDHFSYLNEVFKGEDLPKLKYVYVSGDYTSSQAKLEEVNKKIKDSVCIFNGGKECGTGESEPCVAFKQDTTTNPCGRSEGTKKTKDKWDLDICPNQKDIKGRVLVANLKGTKKDAENARSIVFKLIWKSISVLMTGDFQGKRTMKKLLENHSEDLPSTVYKLAHHGAYGNQYDANHFKLLDAVKPQAAFASSNPWFSHQHPKCAVIEHLKKNWLCNIEKDNNRCERKSTTELQKEYSCGQTSSSINNKKRPRIEEDPLEVTDNVFAVYTTTTTKRGVNFPKFVTDGESWGFELL